MESERYTLLDDEPHVHETDDYLDYEEDDLGGDFSGGHDLDHEHHAPSFPPPPRRVGMASLGVKNIKEAWYKRTDVRSFFVCLVILVGCVVLYVLFLLPTGIVLADGGLQKLSLYLDQSKLSLDFSQAYFIDNDNFFDVKMQNMNVIVSYKTMTIGRIAQTHKDAVDAQAQHVTWEIPASLGSSDNVTVASINTRCDEEEHFYIDYEGSYQVEYLFSSISYSVNENHMVPCNRKSLP
jgi:hypothetical protein